MTRLSLARSLHPPPPPVSLRPSARPSAMPRLPALPSRVCPAAAAAQKEGGGGGLGFDGRGKGKRISTFPPPPPRPSVSAAAAREASEALLVFGRWPPPFTLGGMPMSSVVRADVSKTAVYFRRSASFHSHSLTTFE